jgi:hypothetical protein
VDVDRFFLETLDDLEARAVWGASEYSLLRASALLRELLIDDHPVVHQVNHARGMRLRFRVRQAPPTSSGLHIWLGINPDDKVEESGSEASTTEVGIRDLLALPMVFLPSSTLTVHDLITLGSNVLGGIHLGPPRQARHQELIDYPLKISHGLVPIELVSMVPITAVLLGGIEPLRARVRAEVPPPPPDPDGRIAIRQG